MVSVTQRHDGLCETIKGKRGLIELIRDIGRKGLGLNARQIRYLEISIDWCREGDFREGAICAHWQGVDTLAQELGCSVRQVWNIEMSLEDAGLIQRTFGRNGHRCGKRGGAKDILWAAGINLAPLLDPEMLLRLLELRKDLDEERAAQEILRGEIQLVRRQIRACGDEGAILRMDLILPGGRTSRLTDRGRLQELLEALQAVHAVIAAASGDAKISDGDAGIANASEISDAPYTLKRPSKNSCMGSAREKRAKVSPRQAMLLASTDYQTKVELLGGPSAANLVEASSQSCVELGIAPRAWGQLCDRLGREAAALTILVIDRNARLPQDDPYHVRKPGGCAFGIARRAKSGSVNLHGMLLAGLRMDLDRELPGSLSRDARSDDEGCFMKGLLSSVLKNFDLEVRP
ncbi:replication initiation protein RepC [Novosphingobium beihaiensis]|uniref:Replication initiation protein RepC n=1 Tax=Novosphingobium beihaiensis TaxID=2930389 RepID=A0ABT0BUD6_9SPHN|nr:replication initiation protein RepC [Novosphingobium beihaiensis]MCJ2188595.1 replication initiation protein RepC [Novosphingobium beihaiensis]